MEGAPSRPILALGALLGAGLAFVGALELLRALGRIPSFGAVAWLFFFLLTIAIRAPYAVGARAIAVKAQRRDLTDRLSIMLMSVTMMILPLIAIATPWLDGFNYALTRPIVLAGVLLGAAGLLLFWRSHADLGANWSPALEVREEHRLITNGVYGHMRHPMYAAMWLQALGQALMIENWLGGALVLPAIALLYFLRVPKEERLMAAEFGDQWRAYAARTGRVIPRLR
jgi:protein-S-isoprenylcysteine O-methyltransferase Ste14